MNESTPNQDRPADGSAGGNRAGAGGPTSHQAGDQPGVGGQPPRPAPATAPADREAGWELVGAQWREVADQVRELGVQLSAAFQSGWSAPRGDAAASLRDELRGAADRLDAAMAAARAEAERAETRARLEQAGAATREAGESLLGEVRDVAAQGLRALNDQLASAADRLETERRQRPER